MFNMLFIFTQQYFKLLKVLCFIIREKIKQGPWKIDTLSSQNLNATFMNMYGTVSTPTSTPESFSTVFKASTSIFTIFLILGTIFGNMLVILAFIMFYRIRMKTNIFLVSLACTDLCVALLSMPLWTVYLLTGPGWVLHHVLIRIWTLTDILFGTASIMNLMVISIDRLICINKPLEYDNVMTWARIRAAVIFVWAYSLLLAMTSYFLWYYAIFNLAVSIISFFLPLMFISTAYALIFKIALRHAREIKTATPDLSKHIKPGSFGLLKSVKAVKTLAVVVGAFVICWIPFFALNMTYSLCVHCPINPNLILVTKWMHYGNSFINPVIYALISRDFRLSFKKLLVCCTKTKQEEFFHMHFNMQKPT